MRDNPVVPAVPGESEEPVAGQKDGANKRLWWPINPGYRAAALEAARDDAVAEAARLSAVGLELVALVEPYMKPGAAQEWRAALSTPEVSP